MIFQALWQDGIPLIQWGAAIGASLAAAVFDLVKRQIPNTLVACVFAGGLAFAGIVAGIPGLVDSLVGSVVLAAPYFVLFLVARGGGGDAKLMGAVGAWLGIVNGMIALFCVSMAGIFVALAYATAYRRKARSPAETATCSAGQGAMIRKSVRTMTIPFGVAIFIGVCMAGIGVWIWRG